MNKNMELVPAARNLERALSKSTAPTAAKGAREAPKVGGDRAGGGGELARVTMLRLTNHKNEVTFTTGDIRSVHANIAHQEGLSKEFITPQMLAGQRASSEKSTHMCKKYTKGQCRRHMFDTYQRPADSSCRFTHGNREQTGKVACYHKSECSDMGCPYLHPPERQAMAMDANGDLMASNA
jgi:hypothetical protein